MTYIEEKRIKDAAKAKRSQVFEYQPVGFDIFRPCQGNTLTPGDRVVKVSLHGAPKNGTMGQCYVGDPETGQFICMVNVNSLTKVAR